MKFETEVRIAGIENIEGKINIIVPNINITIHQITNDEISPIDPLQAHIEHTPSSLLYMQMQLPDEYKIQSEILKAIAVLRLFRLGSIFETSYTLPKTGRLIAGKKWAPLVKYSLNSEDENRLNKFWHEISNVMPNCFYDHQPSRIESKGIAYRNYCDGLLRNTIAERRIANSVMGLEGLLLSADEKSELSYRLKYRTAKILSFLCMDPVSVRDTMALAYKVRNDYVHGSQTSENRKSEIEKQHGSINLFTNVILEYLRKLIVLMLFIDVEKDDFIRLVDDSCFGGTNEKTLIRKIEFVTNKI